MGTNSRSPGWPRLLGAYSMTTYSRVRLLHRALHHLDVPADAVLLVHDEVAGLQLQRVDGVASPAGQPAHALGRRAGLPHQVGLGQDGEPQRIADEAAPQAGARHVHQGGIGYVGQRLVQPGRDVLAGQHLDDALRRAVPLGEHHHPVAVAEPALDVGQRPRRVAAVALDAAGRDHRGLLVVRHLVGGERADRPPRQAELAGPGPDVGQAAVRRGAEVDRGRRTGGRVRPGRLEELLAGGEQVVRPGADPLRVLQHDVGAGRQLVEQQRHVVDQERGQRLHALDHDALGELTQHVGQARVRDGQVGGALTHLGGKQHLPARRRPHAVLGDLERPLVGDLEPAHLLDGVAPQLDPQRVLVGRREDVDDPAADGELAAPLDQVDPGVGGSREPLDDVVQVDLVARLQGHRLELAEAGHHRLQHRTHRRHHDLHRAVLDVRGVRVRQPAQDGEAATDGVAARAQPLVRQRLPGRELDDRARLEQVTQGGGELLRLTAGRGDGEHRPAGPGGQRRQRERADPGRGGEVEIGAAACRAAASRAARRAGSPPVPTRRSSTPVRLTRAPLDQDGQHDSPGPRGGRGRGRVGATPTRSAQPTFPPGQTGTPPGLDGRRGPRPPDWGVVRRPGSLARGGQPGGVTAPLRPRVSRRRPPPRTTRAGSVRRGRAGRRAGGPYAGAPTPPPRLERCATTSRR